MNNEKQANYLKALGHPVRLQIVKMLIKDGPLSVGEIEVAAGIRQANASQHLGILKIAGIVKSERDGNLKYYSLCNGREAKLLKILEDLK